MSSSGRLHPDIVPLAVKVEAVAFDGASGSSLAILRMKIESAGRKRLAISPVIDIEIERLHRLAALVAHRDLCVPLERYAKKRVQCFRRANSKGYGVVEKIIAQTESKKIAHGRFDARRRLTVPVHAQHEFLQMVPFGTGDGDPYMGNDAGTSFVNQGERLARRHATIILVSPRPIIARGPFRYIVVRLDEVGKQVTVPARLLAESRSQQPERHYHESQSSHARPPQDGSGRWVAVPTRFHPPATYNPPLLGP